MEPSTQTAAVCHRNNSTVLQVVSVDPLSDRRWQEFAAGHPEATIYHQPGWIAALQEEYRQEGAFLLCTDHTGQTVAILPALFTRGVPGAIGGSLAQRRLSSLPRTPLGGPLWRTRDAASAVLREAIHRARARHGALLQIKMAGPSLDNLAEGLVGTPWRFTYILPLPGVPGAEFQIANPGNRGGIERAVRKAARSGVRIRAAETASDVRNWYWLYVETMRRNMMPARSLRFFQALWNHLRPSGSLELLLAELDDGSQSEMLAGSLFLRHGQTTTYAFGGSSTRHLDYRPNDSIMMQAIQGACRQGCSTFDFGEVPEGHTSLAKFKTKWGAGPSRLYRYYCPGRAVADDSPPHEPGTLRNLLEKTWLRLPLPLIAWIGDQIYNRL